MVVSVKRLTFNLHVLFIFFFLISSVCFMSVFPLLFGLYNVIFFPLPLMKQNKSCFKSFLLKFSFCIQALMLIVCRQGSTVVNSVVGYLPNLHMNTPVYSHW